MSRRGLSTAGLIRQGRARGPEIVEGCLTRPGSSVATSPLPLQVLAPGAGAKVDGQHPLFRWSAVPGSDYYDVRIVNDSGDLLVEHRVEGTEWRPATPLELQPGAEYFVQVEAHPSQAKTVSSDHVPFLVSD